MTASNAEHPSVSPALLDDPATVERELTSFIRTFTRDAGAEGVVIALSGGVDSTVTATLAVEALGSGNVHGLILPAATSSGNNVSDAIQVAEELAIDHRELDIQPLVDQVVRMLTMRVEESRHRSVGTPGARHISPTSEISAETYRHAVGNVAARMRMVLTYFEANLHDRLVLGTGNRTELLLGYFTKYGDGGVDLLPIGDLYKSHVWELGSHLGIPETIIEKPPTAGLWVDQTDEDELGAPYPVIDAVLERLVDEGMAVEAASEALGVDPELVTGLAELHSRTAHKRQVPPTPSAYRSGE